MHRSFVRFRPQRGTKDCTQDDSSIELSHDRALKPNDQPSRGSHPALVFVLIFAAVFALHAPLLRLPYFWDEAGYYVPAARDLFLTGSLIPHSTMSNAHPPLVMAYLAMWWKVAGFTPAVTRTAMLLAAAFALLGLFRLARAVASIEVARQPRC